MTEQHPIVPPQEIVQEWISRWLDGDISEPYPDWFAARSAQWGADGELEACRQWLEINGAPRELIDGLLAARRPKPLSLKEQALADFNWLIGRTLGNPEVDERSKRILQALESLSND